MFCCRLSIFPTVSKKKEKKKGEAAVEGGGGEGGRKEIASLKIQSMA